MPHSSTVRKHRLSLVLWSLRDVLLVRDSAKEEVYQCVCVSDQMRMYLTN